MQSDRYILLFRSLERLNRLRRNYINVKEQTIKESNKILIASF
jgi:hypothetical protein